MQASEYITIVSPYPGDTVFLDGWMSRIKTIDLLFDNIPRVYIDFQEWFPADNEPELVCKTSLISAYRVNPWSDKHRIFARKVFNGASFVYIHTLHQCEYMIDFFESEKMFIDIHGVVPEEEAMMGSEERSQKFEDIERNILAKARRVSVVTRSMRRHYEEKYSQLTDVQYVHLPVFDYSCINTGREVISSRLQMRATLPKLLTTYAGGSQRWQCVDAMMRTIKATLTDIDYEIYSHNIDDFKSILSRYEINPGIFKGNVGKAELEQVYRRSTFGFSIREDIVVNRVASPTKICDYCSNLVIPIIDFTEIGDFEDYNYAYVSLDDYQSGFIPDVETQEWMIGQNIRCMREMYTDFVRGATTVLNMVHERTNRKFQS